MAKLDEDAAMQSPSEAVNFPSVSVLTTLTQKYDVERIVLTLMAM